ncbi:MAG: c-type cytochrome [Actinobacteria bacterium]|nr:MAG: c-type cytochrome [Actinomycetota bacterium]
MARARRPIAVLIAVSLTAFGLAEWHVLKPGTPKAAAGSTITVGDAYRGETVFQQNCAVCHGAGGKGGSAGPRLAGATLTLARVKAQIDAGGGAMPPAIVTGRDEEDVLAYVAGIVAQ